MQDSKDDIITLLKEKYEYEISRRKYFDNVLGTPITVLSFIVTGMYLVTFDSKLSNLTYPFSSIKWIIIVLLLFSCLITLYFLFKVYFGLKRQYRAMPTSDDINSDYKKLLVYHAKSDDIEGSVKSDLKDFIITWYTTCNNENQIANDKRMNAFFYVRLFIGISLILGTLLIIFIGWVKAFHLIN